MLTKAMRELKALFNFENHDRNECREVLNACRYFDYKYAHIQDTLANGGMDTLLDWIEDGMPIEVCERLEKLPLTFVYNDVDFCHTTPIYKLFKEVNDLEYEGKPVKEWDATSLLWSRVCLDSCWAPKRLAIFGHTPVPFLPDYVTDMKLQFNEMKDVIPIKWGDPEITGEKFDMDTGAVFLGRAFVLNVLTMKAYGFEDKDFMNKEIHKHDIEKIEVIQF
jgi:hypothetical protein